MNPNTVDKLVTLAIYLLAYAIGMIVGSIICGIVNKVWKNINKDDFFR